MKGYLYRIFVFLLPVIIIGSVMEVLLRRIPNDFRNKKNYLDEKAEFIEVLILGGSHSLSGINPVHLEETSFNASQVSQTLDLDLELLHKYANRLSNLNFIILPISYPSLYEKLEMSSEPWRLKNYCIYYDMKVTFHLPYYLEILSNTLKTNIIRLGTNYILKSGNAFCTELGWDTTFCCSPRFQNLEESGKEAAKIHTWDNDQYFDEMVLALESIIEFAEKKRCKIVLFTPPAFHSYRENLNQIQLKRTIEATRSISRKYDNCYYYNMLDDEAFTEIDFYNADHLNKIGAEKLTSRIRNSILDIEKIISFNNEDQD